jgi:anti-anti-sigma regulatory factor
VRHVRIERTTRDGCEVVALHGRLDLRAVPRLRRTLLKLLAEGPPAVICDLTGLSAMNPLAATIFTAVAHHPAGGWPTTSLLLCGARPGVAAVLGRLNLTAFLRTYPTLQDALANATARPPYLREDLVLATSPRAPGAVRRFVEEVCRSWRVDQLGGDGDGERTVAGDLTERAVLLADELVTNAVVHAGAAGDLRLRLELHGRRLRLVVQDAVPRMLRLATPAGVESERGRGLLLVDQLATTWGVLPRRDGKAVWCMLDP